MSAIKLLSGFLPGYLMLWVTLLIGLQQADDIRRQRIGRVRDLVTRAASIDDRRAQIRAQLGIAGALWKDDRSFARGLLITIYNTVSNSSHETGTVDVIDKSNKAERNALRNQVITTIAKLDSQLLTELLEKDAASNGVDRATDYVHSALTMMQDDPKRAAELTEQSLRKGVAKELVYALNELRKKDSAAANGLFIVALRRIAAEPMPNLEEFLWLGSYLFTAPQLSSSNSNAIVFTRVGNIATVNISTRRTDAPSDLVVKFLEVAVDLLTRPNNRGQLDLLFAAGYQLLPMVRESLPERAPALAAAMQSLMPNVSREMTQPSAYDGLLRSNYNDASVEQILGKDKLPRNRAERDAYLLAHGSNFLYSNDCDKARSLFSLIDDSSLRSALLSLIDFTEIKKLIEEGNLDSAERRTRGLSPGMERSLLQVAIGRHYSEKRAASNALEAFNAAAADLRDLHNPRSAALLMIIAGYLSDIDRVGSLQLLSESINLLNRNDIWLVDVKWQKTVKKESVSRVFDLSLRDINLDLGAAMGRVLDCHSDGAIEILLTLKTPIPSAEALSSIAGFLLK